MVSREDRVSSDCQPKRKKTKIYLFRHWQKKVYIWVYWIYAVGEFINTWISIGNVNSAGLYLTIIIWNHRYEYKVEQNYTMKLKIFFILHNQLYRKGRQRRWCFRDCNSSYTHGISFFNNNLVTSTRNNLVISTRNKDIWKGWGRCCRWWQDSLWAPAIICIYSGSKPHNHVDLLYSLCIHIRDQVCGRLVPIFVRFSNNILIYIMFTDAYQCSPLCLVVAKHGTNLHWLTCVV